MAPQGGSWAPRDPCFSLVIGRNAPMRAPFRIKIRKPGESYIRRFGEKFDAPVAPEHPPLISRENCARIAPTDSVDSCSFAMRFAFVPPATLHKPTPRRSECLGVNGIRLNVSERDSRGLFERVCRLS